MPQKILLVRTSSLGDIIHTLPIAYDIKHVMPDAKLHWLSEESFSDVCTLSPFVDVVKKTAFRRWRKTLFSSKTWSEIRALKADLRSEHYDIVIDTQGLLRSAWAASWSGSPVFGYSRDTVRESLATLFYNQTKRLPESIGTVRRYRKMAALCLGYSIDEGHPKFGLKAPNVPEGVTLPHDYATLFVSTSQERKNWQEDRWKVLIEELKAQGLDSVLFWGNEKEKERALRIAGNEPFVHVLPRMPIPAVAAVVAHARIGIGVDTGLMHLAAALARPCVGIWVDTIPENISLIGEADCATLGGKGADVTVKDVLVAVRQRIPLHS